MATYAKILKDPSGNQILPYTRAKLVYMDDNTTVQDAVLQPATNAQMGRVLIGNNLGYDGKGTISLSKFGVCNALGYTPISPTDYADNNKYGVVKVGSNILEEDGVISVDDRCIKEALGYTPSDSYHSISSFIKDSNTDELSTVKYKNGVSITQDSSSYSYFSLISHKIYISKQFLLGYFYGILSKDFIAHKVSIEYWLQLETLKFSQSTPHHLSSIFNYLDNSRQTTPSGTIMTQCVGIGSGGSSNNTYNGLMIDIIPSVTIPSGNTIKANYIVPLN